MTPREQAAFEERRPMLITKTSARSRVHRRVPMDHDRDQTFRRDGRPSGGCKSSGCSPRPPITVRPRNIPYLRRKVAGALARAGFTPDSHSGRALANVLDTYPRDELFQIDEDTLFHFALIILQLNERPRVRVLTRLDIYERFDRFSSMSRASAMTARPRRDRPAAGVGLQRRDRLVRPVFHRRAVGARAFHRRAPRRAASPIPIGAQLEAGVVAGHEDVAGSPARGAAGRARSAGGARSLRALSARRFRRPIAKPSAPRSRSATSRPSSDVERRAARRRLSAAPGRRRTAPRLKAVEPRTADAAFGTRAGAGTYGLHAWSTRAPITSSRWALATRQSGCTTCARPRRRRRDRFQRCATGSMIALPRSCAARPRATATTHWCCAPAWLGATWPWCARCRAICARSAFPTRQDYMWATLRQACRRCRAASWRCSRPLRSAALDIDAERARSAEAAIAPKSRKSSQRSEPR